MNGRKSSLLNLDENVAAMLVVATTLGLSFIGFVSHAAWVVPLLVLLLEKESQLVRISAAQALAAGIGMLACSLIRAWIGMVWSADGLFAIPRVLTLITFSLVQVACLVYAVLVGYHAYYGRVLDLPVLTAQLKEWVHYKN